MWAISRGAEVMRDLKIGDRVRVISGEHSNHEGSVICGEHSPEPYDCWRVRLDDGANIVFFGRCIERIEECMEAPTIDLRPRPTAEDPIQAWLKEAQAPEFREVTLIAWRPSLELWEVGIISGVIATKVTLIPSGPPYFRYRMRDIGGFGHTLESAWAQAMYYLAAGDAVYAAEYPVIAQQKARGE